MPKTRIDRSIDQRIVDVWGDYERYSQADRRSKRFKRALRASEIYYDGDTSQLKGYKKTDYEAPYRELILPALNGQYRIWKAQLSRRSDMADKVVQIGNLLGLQPNSIDPMFKNKTVYSGNKGLVFSLFKFYSKTHDGWEQLAGINELVAILDENIYLCSERATEILAEHWFDPQGILKVATVVNGLLVTHRGMTHREWMEIGLPEDPYVAAERLNEKYKGAYRFVDSYATSGIPNFQVSPLWADPYVELVQSWLFSGDQAPFGQIVGSPGFSSPAGKQFLNDRQGFMHYMDKSSVRIKQWGSSVRVADQDIIFAYSQETEIDSTLRKMEKTQLLQYVTETTD